MTYPTDDKLEEMAREADRRWRLTRDKYHRDTGAMLRACKTGDAPDHSEWDAAIEAAADKAYLQADIDARPQALSEAIRALKKGQTNG